MPHVKRPAKLVSMPQTVCPRNGQLTLMPRWWGSVGGKVDLGRTALSLARQVHSDWYWWTSRAGPAEMNLPQRSHGWTSEMGGST